MPMQVCTGAQLMCSFGAAPSVFTATPKTVQTSYMDAGTIMDFVPMNNIKPFGMCTSLANPQVAAATTAASGVLTPQPCIPVTTSPWVPGVTNVLIANQPALDNMCKLMCNWAGVITVANPGQTTHQIP